jgi:hypothetical protein
MKMVLDSSVVIAAVKREEVNHLAAVTFLEGTRGRGDEVLAPVTALWDIGAALAHPGKTPVGSVFNKTLELNVGFLPVDQALFQRTWDSDTRVPVKGPDRIFISCALDQRAVLVSWDRNLVANARALGVDARTPEEITQGIP